MSHLLLDSALDVVGAVFGESPAPSISHPLLSLPPGTPFIYTPVCSLHPRILTVRVPGFERNRDVFRRVKSFCQVSLPLITTLIMFRGFETFPCGCVSLFRWEHRCHMVDYLFFPCQPSLTPTPIPTSRQASRTFSSMLRGSFQKHCKRGTLGFVTFVDFGTQDGQMCHLCLVGPGPGSWSSQRHGFDPALTQACLQRCG